jgi:SAM-dependent methyltransferase
MVHALSEIERTLKPGGILIDLRPLADHWTVEVSTLADFKTAGYLTDMPVGLADDEAANRAMQEAEARGWFTRKRSEEFSFFYYWDTPSEMKEFMESEWEDFEKMEEDVYRKARSLWASANADARLRVRVKMFITQWEKWWS